MMHCKLLICSLLSMALGCIIAAIVTITATNYFGIKNEWIHVIAAWSGLSLGGFFCHLNLDRIYDKLESWE